MTNETLTDASDSDDSDDVVGQHEKQGKIDAFEPAVPKTIQTGSHRGVIIMQLMRVGSDRDDVDMGGLVESQRTRLAE